MLSERQLIDAIAVGQLTLGPVFTTATFVGYLVGGVRGGLLATVAIFLPAFVYVAVTAPILPRLRQSPVLASALDGVNVASLALMTAVTWQLGRVALTDLTTIVIALSSGVVLWRRRVNVVWLLLGGAVIGLLRLI